MRNSVMMLAVLCATASSAALAAPAANTAPAQPNGAAAADDTASGSQLGEIIVTAQRRSENLQKVPIAVTAATGAELKTAGVANVLDIARIAPSVSIQAALSSVTPFIRGIGTSVVTVGNEASSAVYIDGVYVVRPYPNFLPFDYVDRVEVLKGPQGTLFGRNSTGGLINIITRTPSETPEMQGTISYGNYKTIKASAYVSTGLWQGAAISLTGYNLYQGDGWGHDVTTGQEIEKQKKYGGRAKLVDNVTDNTKITLAAGYNRSWDSFSLSSNPVLGTTQGNPIGSPPVIYTTLPGYYDVRGDTIQQTRAHSFDAMGRIDQDVGFANLVSLSGYRKSVLTSQGDFDYTPVPFFNAVLVTTEKQFSQEFQIVSPQGAGSKLNWIAGLYYLYKNSQAAPVEFTGTQFGPAVVDINASEKVRSYSGYGQATYEVLPKLKVTLGGRYTVDKVSLFGHTDVTIPGLGVIPGAPLNAASTYKKFTYRAALDYQLTQDVLLYGSVSRGFKSGVYGTLPPSTTPVKPEIVDAYELGFKSELLDRHLRLNGAIFQSNVKNAQVTQTDNAAVFIVNAGTERVRGAELEAELVATSQLTLHASGTYLNAKYTSFNNAPFTVPNNQLVNGMVPGCSVPATGNLNPANGGNVDFCAGNATGNRISRDPKFQGEFRFDYTVPLSGGSLRLSPSISYNSGFFWDSDNHLKQQPYKLVDATVAYTFPGNSLTLRAYGQNLTKTRYALYAGEQSGPNGYPYQPAAPRTYGVALDFNF